MKYDAILIAGPTASGKSAVAVELARSLNGVVVNADSMQVYAEAPLLTARPGPDTMAKAPHLLYGHVSARQAYSTGRFMEDAKTALERARQLGKLPIFTGGTGLYFNSLTNGLAEIPPVPEDVRTAARALLTQIGPEALHRRLAERDPQTAAGLQPGDSQRVLRAWEVLEATGRPLSEWQQTSTRPLLEGLQLGKFVIDVPRPVIRRRIADRFNTMLDNGAVEEAKSLSDLDPALPAAKLLGLRELQAYAAGQKSRKQALEEAVTATRRYAKRQTTWFRGQMGDYNWISLSNFIS